MESSTPLRSVTLLAFLLALALATIGAAWYYELVVGYIPCKLCLMQRNPYYIGIPLTLAGLFAAWRGVAFRYVALLAGLAGLVFLINAGLGAYHAGVEWGFWLGPSDCGGRVPTLGGSAGDLLAQMQNAKVVSCSEASWRLLGLSFAGWNAVLSLGLAGLGFAAARKS